jgi:uncharacterized membrane protein
MNEADHAQARERVIANLLWFGTLLASAIIAVGVLLGFFGDGNGLGIAKVGVALFILLPVGRVGLMLVLFVRERDYAYVAISALVLAIIAAGFLIGL